MYLNSLSGETTFGLFSDHFIIKYLVHSLCAYTIIPKPEDTLIYGLLLLFF